jgi:hypothetical protein
MKERSCCAYQRYCAVLVRVDRTMTFLNLFRLQIVGSDHVFTISNSHLRELFAHFALRSRRFAAA